MASISGRREGMMHLKKVKKERFAEQAHLLSSFSVSDDYCPLDKKTQNKGHTSNPFPHFFGAFWINFCWMTNSLIGPIFLCIQGEKLLTLRLFEKYPCGKILGQSLVLPREYQNRVWKVSFLILRKRGKESRVGNTIRSCHYQTHSFAMNL